jgi:hypothetical protein
MLGQLIWCSSIALEMILLLRGFQNRLVHRLPVFYGYVSFVLLQEFARLSTVHKNLYKSVYWSTEFLALAIGSLVVFEVYRVSLAAYPGAARLARNALAFVFLVALVKGILNAPIASMEWQNASVEIERELRLVQAAAIFALVTLFLLYSIPFGRNLRGILLGYGLFVGERVICLTFVSLGTHDFWFYAYSASYIASLTLWMAYLWSYQPSPHPKRRVDLDDEYRKIATATQRQLDNIRGFLRKAVRS